MSSPLTPEREAELRRQLQVLQAKSEQATEPIVRSALDSRIQQLQAELGTESPVLEAPENAQVAVPEEPTSSPSPLLEYWVATPDGQHGPFSSEDLQAKLDRQEFGEKALVWREGLSAWLPREQIEEFRLASALAEPDPAVPQRKRRLEDDIVIPPKADPASAQRAEELLRQAQLCRVRNQPAEAARLVAQAVELAPGHSVVQEALGDQLRADGKKGEARQAFYKAQKLDPKNVSAERKYAEMVLGAGMAMTWESAMIHESEAIASAKAGVLFSAIVPGAGQLVSGKYVSGGIFIGIWTVTTIILAVMKEESSQLLKAVIGKGGHPSALLWFVVLIGFLNWLASVMDMAKATKGTGLPGAVGMAAMKAKVEKPEPPVNLPFE